MTYEQNSYLALFKAIQSIEDVLREGQAMTNDFDADIESMRVRMEAVIDKTVESAASFGWQRALRWGGFQELYNDFCTLSGKLAAYQ